MKNLIEKLDKAKRAEAKDLDRDQARCLVDAYYMIQGSRVATGNQRSALDRSEKTSDILFWMERQQREVEDEIAKLLDKWSEAFLLGRWARSVCGIGPVISAALMAHINIDRTKSISSLWRFAGLDPTCEWKKGEKRPFNATLRMLCAYKIGESFVKVSNKDDDLYGKVYAERKLIEMEMNERGDFAAQAADALKKKTYRKDTVAFKCYQQGQLPPAHIHRRAVRKAVKLFLSHYWQVAYEIHYGKQPPAAYVFAHMGHVHEVPPPNWPMIEKAVGA